MQTNYLIFPTDKNTPRDKKSRGVNSFIFLFVCNKQKAVYSILMEWEVICLGWDLGTLR